MKTKQKNQKKKNVKIKDRGENSDEELAELVEKIKDDQNEVMTSVGDGEDVPADEISNVIKELQLDRFRGDSSKSKPNKRKKEIVHGKEEKKQESTQKIQTDSIKSQRNKTKKASLQGKEDKQHEKTENEIKDGPNKQGLPKQKKKEKLKGKGKGATNVNQERTNTSHPTKAKSDSKMPGSNVKKSGLSAGLKVTNSTVMLLSAGVKWFSIEGTTKLEGNQTSKEEVVKSYLEYATQLYDNEVELYASRKSSESGSQSQWMQTVAKSGALSDKVAALTLEVQGAPLHSPLSLDGLLGMVRKKGRREALLGLDAVKRLFLEEMLPSNRKLTTFSQHCFEELEKRCKNDSKGRDKQILLWFFEDQLKHKYGSLLDLIEKMLQDTVVAIKAKALSVCYELLVNRSEQEKRLLGLIVNKVGDPDYKVAAKAVHWLQKLVEVHAMMKLVVVQSVEQLLFRPNISTKAQYYAICFLNQLVLHPEEDQLATQLIIVYLSFFKACTKQKVIDNKMLSAVITGVHRAFPYAKEDEKVHEQLDALLKVVHLTTFNTSIQALLLIKQVLDKRKSTMDRFYSALYRKLLDPQLSSSPRHAMFLNLLYQTLKEDELITRVKAFMKRLLQVCSWQQPPFIAAVLVLVSELIKAKPSLGSFNTWADDSDDEHFMDVEEEEEGEKVSPKEPSKTKTKTETKPTEDHSSWVHRQQKQGDSKDVGQGYNALARNPLHSHVDDAVIWELEVLSKHFHPSVALFASQLLAGTTVGYTGNPLQDFTATRFLDRFVYRNPKQKLVGKESVMQPKSRSYKPPAIRRLAVNSKDFTSLSEDSVPIDEMFFHRFFTGKDTKSKKPTDKKEEKENTAVEGDDKDEDKDDDEGDDDGGLGTSAGAETVDDFDSDASSIDDDEFDRILDEMDGNMDDDDNDMDEEDGDIDFAGEFQKKTVGKQTRKRKMADDDDDESSADGSDDDDEEDDDDGESAEDADVDDDGDMGKSADIDGLDEEGFDMSDDDDDFPATKIPKKKQKRNRKEAKKAVKTSGKLTDVTEQISSMIDDNVGSKFDSGLHALANKDKADVKQLQWEVNRDRWVRGADARSKIRAKKLKQGPKAKGFKNRNTKKHKR